MTETRLYLVPIVAVLLVTAPFAPVVDAGAVPSEDPVASVAAQLSGGDPLPSLVTGSQPVELSPGQTEFTVTLDVSGAEATSEFYLVEQFFDSDFTFQNGSVIGTGSGTVQVNGTFTDYSRGGTLVLAVSGNVSRIQYNLTHAGEGGPISGTVVSGDSFDPASGFDGEIIGADPNFGRSTSPATPPVASLIYSPSTVYAGDTVTFDPSGSTDVGSGIVRYDWDFGNNSEIDINTTPESPELTAQEAPAGTQEIRLVVYDEVGNANSTTVTLTVLNESRVDASRISFWNQFPIPFRAVGGAPSNGEDIVELSNQSTVDIADVIQDAPWYVNYDASDDQNNLRVYDISTVHSAGIQFGTFDHTTPNVADEFTGMDAQVVVARFDEKPTSVVDVVELLRQPSSHDAEFEVLDDGTDPAVSTIDENGIAFEYKPDQSGQYAFFATVVEDGTGFSVSDGLLNLDGNVTVVGYDDVLVRSGTSSVSVQSQNVSAGESIDFQADSGLDGDVTHVVAVYNATALAESPLELNLSDSDYANLTRQQQRVLLSGFTGVDGVNGVDSGTRLFGVHLNDASGTNAMTLPAFLQSIAVGADLSGEFPVVGLNPPFGASVASVAGGSPTETITVGTSSTWQAGEYAWLHVAVTDGGSDFVTDSGTVAVNGSVEPTLIAEPSVTSPAQDVNVSIVNAESYSSQVAWINWFVYLNESFVEMNTTYTPGALNNTLSFDEPGVHHVVAQAYDNLETPLFEASTNVTVDGTLPNALVFANRSEAVVNESVVRLYAGDSNDPDGDIVEFRWDVDGDGVIDSTTSSSVREITHVYDRTGTFYPAVTVVDDDGLTATDNDTVTVTAPDSVATGAWPQFHFDDGNTGYDPTGSGPIGPVTERWSVSLHQPHTYPVTVAQGLVYNVEGNSVWAWDATDGTREWISSISLPAGTQDFRVTGAPTVVDGRVYVGAYFENASGADFDRVYVFDAETGASEWTFSSRYEGFGGHDFDAEIGAPKVVDGRLYFVSEGSDTLYAVNATPGSAREELWNHSLSGSARAPVAVNNGTVYAVSSSELSALNASTGAVVWSKLPQWATEAAPSVVGDRLYVAGGGAVTAYNATNGTLLWSTDGSVTSARGSAAVADDLVLVTQTEHGTSREPLLTAVYAENGSIAWTFTTNGSVTGAPAVVGTDEVGHGRIAYVGTMNGTVHAVEVSSGSELWNYTLSVGEGTEYNETSQEYDVVPVPVPIFTAPAVADNTVYFRAGSNGMLTRAVYAIGDADPVQFADADLAVSPATARASTDTVTATVTNLTGATPSSYRFAFGDGTVVTTTHPDADATHLYDQVGTYTVTVTAFDDLGRVMFTDTATVTIEVAGDATLTAAPDPARMVLDTVTFELVDRQGVTPTTYDWAFGDGATATTTHPDEDATHTYDAPGTYTATVTARNAGGSALYEATTTVNVTPAGAGDLVVEPPVVDVNVTETTLRLTNVTLPPSVASVRYEWAYGDGDGAFTTANDTTHVYGTMGGLEASVSVLDASTESTLFTANATVSVVDRVPPVVTASAPSEAIANETVTVDVSNSTDNHRIANVTVETDDGASITTTDGAVDLTFSTTGTRLVNVTAVDPSGNRNTTSLTVTVREPPDLTVDLSVREEQNVNDGVRANVTVANVGNTTARGVQVALDVGNGSRYWNYRSNAERFTRSIGDLAPGQNRTVTVDFTGWAGDHVSSTYYTSVQLTAVADPGDSILESDEGNNSVRTDTDVSFSDVRADVYFRSTVTNVSQPIRISFRNYGKLASDNHTAEIDFGDGSPNVTVEVPPLSRWERHSVELNHVYSTPGDYTVTVNVTDDPIEAGNVDSDTEEVEEYSVSIREVRAPDELERDGAFYARVYVSRNYDYEANITLRLPEGLEFTDGSRARTQFDAGRYEYWRVRAVNESGPDGYQLNATVESRGLVANGSETIRVVPPKIRLANTTSVTVQNDGSGTTVGEIRTETTYDHSIEITGQLGAEGRTLSGLEYLFRYPHGCIEQTTSPLLGALNTDKYYRTRPAPDDYNRVRVNTSIAAGVARLSSGGGAGQHGNGAWSMYGNSPSGHVFYTAYALFGTGSVANDPVQSARPEVSAEIDGVDFDAAVVWLDEAQRDDGSVPNDKRYFRDEHAMTGFTLLAIDVGGPYDATAEAAADRIRENATRYLVANQHADGYWDTDGTANGISTAVAVWGMQTALPHLDNATLAARAEASIDEGAVWLLDQQQPDGSWPGAFTDFSWSREGQVSHTTAYALMALNATGVPAENESIRQGTAFLVGVYDDEGSWGYTRASAIAIDALQRLDTGVENANQTITILLGNETTPDVVTKPLELDGESAPRATIELTDEELGALRDATDGTVRISVAGDGTGTVVLGIENSQLVDKDEYEASTGGE